LKRACLPLRCSRLAFVLALLTGAAAFGQVSITSSPNVVGSGARALGMGGAFIAVADDATAASWNPGGLTQLERPELSLVYNFKKYSEDFRSETYPVMDMDNSLSIDEINYFSFVYPIRRTIAGRNLVLSLNYQRKFDFDRNLDFEFIGGRTHSTIEYRQRGALGSLSPAFGFELSDRLSFGVVMNIWDQSLLSDNEWKVRNDQRQLTWGGGGGMLLTHYRQEQDYENFKGTSYTLGVRFRATEHLSFGAVYHTKFTAEVDYSERNSLMIFGFPMPVGTETNRDLEITFPSAFGIGAAYRFPNDKLTLSMDITRRDWDQFVLYDDENWNILEQRRSGVTDLHKSWSEHDATWTVRMGAEYAFVNAKKPKQDLLPILRGGLFYDPEPAGGRRDRWFGLGKVTGEVEDYYGASLGLGLLIKNRVNLDFAYVYRWGNDVRKDTFGIDGLTRTDADVRQHLFYLSTVIYF
jgi:long-subunit fatty acid transport protein